MESDVSGKSQLFDSLKAYLNNKNRLQPIIGLRSIIEIVNVGTQNRKTSYFCDVCVCRLDKADMRNHISGSLHRYNYIKACHPHLVVGWQENLDLSKQAWPLMELAKSLEKGEGPGDVQLLEVDDVVHQGIATQSENNALTLINNLRGGRGDSKTALHYPLQSQRTVLCPNNNGENPENIHKLESDFYKFSPYNNKRLSMEAANILSIDPIFGQSSEPESQAEDALIFDESGPMYEHSCSFLYDYEGPKPLIGLSCVVELKSEDGLSCCLLCHCCRIKTAKNDIFEHLTSSSHMINYLMEAYPDQVQAITEDTEESGQLLQNLARKVEQQEGRGDMKTENVPESHRIQLSGKSYHWCLIMLCSEWPQTNTQKAKDSCEGPLVECFPKRSASLGSRELQSKEPEKKKQKTNTVFIVNLPLKQGAMLLKRQSFSTKGRLTALPDPSPMDLDSVSPHQFETEGRGLDCDIRCVTDYLDEDNTDSPSSQPHQELYQDEVNVVDYGTKDFRESSVFRDEEKYLDNSNYLNHYQIENGREGENGSEGRDYRRDRYHQRSSMDEFYRKQKNEGPRRKREEVPSTDYHSKNLSYNCNKKWDPADNRYRPAYNNDARKSSYDKSYKGHTGMNFTSAQYYHQEQHRHSARKDTSVHAGHMRGHRYIPSQPHSEAQRRNMPSHSGDASAQGGSFTPESRVGYRQYDQRHPRSRRDYPYSQRSPSNFQQPAVNYPTDHISQQLMSFAGYHLGPDSHHRRDRTSTDRSDSHHSSWSSKHRDTRFQPGQATQNGGYGVY